MSIKHFEATKPINSYQVEMQVAAYLLSLARQRTTEMERSAQAAEALVSHLRAQNELIETQIALLEHRSWLLEQCSELSINPLDRGECDVNRAL
jgi:hypothetical protein